MFLWVLSQNGKFLLDLHPQKFTMPVSVATYLRGEYFVSLCDPSQKGGVTVCPHWQSQYSRPFSMPAKYGFLRVIHSLSVLLM
jgi:hypothetical protein